MQKQAVGLCGKYEILEAKILEKKIREASPPSSGYENTEDEEIPGDTKSGNC